MGSGPYAYIGELNDTKLLQLLAFERALYRDDAIVVAERIASSRGFSGEQIRTFREKNLIADSAECKCPSCNKTLLLDHSELVSGHFYCPECAREQEIDYTTLTYASNQSDNGSASVLLTGGQVSGSISHTADPPVGLEGWLTLVGVVLVVGFTLGIVDVWTMLIGGDFSNALYPSIVVAYDGFLLYLYFGKKAIFPPLFILLIWIPSILCFLSFAAQYSAAGSLSYFVGTALGASIWTLYIKNSKRVKATFVNPLKSPSPANTAEATPDHERLQGTLSTSDLPEYRSIVSESTRGDARVKCVSCGRLFDTLSNYCPGCGSKVDRVVCTNCGNIAESSHQYCTKCGNRLKSEEQ